MRYLILTLHRDYLGLFGFLQDNPTRVYQQGDYYCFIYREPLSCYLMPFKLTKLWLEVAEQVPERGELVRDFAPAYAGNQLLTELLDLEQHQLAEKRQGIGLALSGWLLDALCFGIHTRQEVAYLVRVMFMTGYDYEQVIGVFTSLTKRLDLARYFLTELNRCYKGVRV
ncbi:MULTISPECIES: hypothetical protein [unclassified Streptococcus]|uniref:hypothetical protein n=1 Tax=unclassified Streptococcus TaxID=2608887 RepID=UPI00359DE3D7